MPCVPSQQRALRCLSRSECRKSTTKNKGKVTRLMNFGAFVEIAPGKEGLVHISKLDTKRVERVEDVVAVGDAIVVKVTDIDQQGRINLSRRDAILALEAKRAAQQQ